MATQKHYRSKEERITDIDSRIASHQAHIETLKKKKEAILAAAAKKKSLSLQAILKKAKAAGMTPEAIAEKLGIK